MILLFRYLWALPNTALGLAFLPLAFLRGRARVVEGVLEVHGPAIAALLRRVVPIAGGAAAITLGHVVLGRDEAALDETRPHERVHVCQYERWGPLFIHAYLLASVWAWLSGTGAYYGNHFERQASGASTGRDPGLGIRPLTTEMAMYEHKTEPLLPWRAFRRRVVSRALWALAFLLGSLAVGTLGFWALAGQELIDALLNSAMLLGGMGPVGDIRGTAGKLFATVFALYAGLAFLAIAGFVGAPIFHRLLHKFHLEEHNRRQAR